MAPYAATCHYRAGVLAWVLVGLCAAASAAAGPVAPNPPDEAAPAVAAEAVADTPPAAPYSATPDAAVAPAADATVSLEQALGETVDPLDQVERQIDAKEYEESISWLIERMASVEDDSHRFDPRLVRPLVLLGDAYAGQGLYQDALAKYQRALHLSRVNGGLNSPDQVEIVYREANALKALGQYQEANDREEYAYHVLNRAHDPQDEALLPGIYHLARWYERTNNVFAARSLYERAADILDAHQQLDTPHGIPALQGIARSYRQERFPPFYGGDLETQPSSIASNEPLQPISVNNFPAGEAALQHIVRIRQAQEPVDQMELALAVLELADWYNLFDKSRRSEPLYAHAWEIMSGIESFDVVSYFAEPELLYFPAPGNPSPPPVEQRGERSTGYVEVAFHVTEDGYVRNLDTVASQPDGMMDFRVRKSLRLARYRPVLVDGVPVAKDAFTYRHEFPYYPEIDRGDAGEATTAAATQGG